MSYIKGRARRFFLDKDGRVVIFQRPNVPIIIWAITLGISKLTEDSASTFFSVISTISLIYWAVLEITSGRSMFRRVLGAAVLVVSLASVFRRI